MKVYKGAWLTLFIIGFYLFSLGKYSAGDWLYWPAGIVLITALVLLFADPFLPKGNGGFNLPTWLKVLFGMDLTPPSAKISPVSRHPVTTTAPLAVGAYVACACISVLGAIAFAVDQGDISPRKLAFLAMIPGGALCFIAAKVYYDGMPGLRNALRGAVAFLGFLAIVAGLYTVVLYSAGVFSGSDRLFWLAGGIFSALAGSVAAWYGIRYQQSRDALAIGRVLGFTTADNGLFAADGAYDSKGEVNGVPVKFKVDQWLPQESKGGSTPPHFCLEVLCLRPNTRELRLEIKPKTLIPFTLSKLPLAPHVDYWDHYEIRTNDHQAAAGPLAAAKAVETIFNDENGFSRLILEGPEFKAHFRLEGYPNADYVRRVLDAVSRLAAALA